MSHFISSSHLVQAIIIGAVMAFLSATILINARINTILTTVNGWRSTLECGQPGKDVLTRAATTKFLPGVNSAEEAMYWLASVDSENKALNGRNAYVLHFAAGQTPPTEAFWSLTITDTRGYMVNTASGRNSVGDRTGLEVNADGSIDIPIQGAAPEQHQQNWLAAPAGNFKLTLRAYLPGKAILEGKYQVPPVVKVH